MIGRFEKIGAMAMAFCLGGGVLLASPEGEAAKMARTFSYSTPRLGRISVDGNGALVIAGVPTVEFGTKRAPGECQNYNLETKISVAGRSAEDPGFSSVPAQEILPALGCDVSAFEEIHRINKLTHGYSKNSCDLEISGAVEFTEFKDGQVRYNRHIVPRLCRVDVSCDRIEFESHFNKGTCAGLSPAVHSLARPLSSVFTILPRAIEGTAPRQQEEKFSGKGESERCRAALCH